MWIPVDAVPAEGDYLGRHQKTSEEIFLNTWIVHYFDPEGPLDALPFPTRGAQGEDRHEDGKPMIESMYQLKLNNDVMMRHLREQTFSKVGAQLKKMVEEADVDPEDA